MSRIETHTLQLWPSGDGYEYRGEPGSVGGEAGVKARRLRRHRFNGKPQERWRKGTKAEWESILVEVRVAGYIEHEVLKCDSMLVSDHLRSGDGMPEDISREWSYDEITNLYPDPSEWDADQCREWLDDRGQDVPSATRQTACALCDQDIEGQIGESTWRDRGNNAVCNASVQELGDPAFTPADHTPIDQEGQEDEHLGELQDAVRETNEAAEIFEWWAVTEWLAGQLTAIGEPVLDNAYGTWWGRTCTGQAMKMDATLQRVARSFS